MKNRMLWIWGIVVIVLIALLGWYVMNGNSFTKKTKSDYQAVFLSNGQVYFGKLSGETSTEPVLKDIYYLQVQQQVQPASSKDQSSQTPQVQLVKLGNEIHGPVDEMRINRAQLLFVEDLKNDGKVVTAIHDFQKNGSTAPAASTDSTKK